MRRAAKRDANEPGIIEALLRCGCSVTQIDNEEGFPDLVVGLAGANYLLEVKDGDKPKSGQKLTKKQVEWHRRWQGQKTVVSNIEEALLAVGLTKYIEIVKKQRGKEHAF